MNSLEIKCEKPIPSKCGCTYKGLAFDGCHFYFTCPERCEVLKYDKALCEIACFTTARAYTCICYDLREDCFWAGTNSCCSRLFKLDRCLHEIDCLALRVSEEGGSMVTGVSYDCEDNRLIVSLSGCVVSVDKCSADYRMLHQSETAWNTGVLALAPSYVVTTQEKNQFVEFYDACGVRKQRCRVPRHYRVESILSYPCEGRGLQRYRLCVLAVKNGYYPYLLEWTIDPWALELPICRCNLLVCNRRCESAPDSREACADLIESIALIEAALSHVLNAEGEKLQKVLACSDDACEILSVNASISDTIVNVTHLEILLHDKLTALGRLCPPCEPPCEPTCGACDPCGG